MWLRCPQAHCFPVSGSPGECCDTPSARSALAPSPNHAAWLLLSKYFSHNSDNITFPRCLRRVVSTRCEREDDCCRRGASTHTPMSGPSKLRDVIKTAFRRAKCFSLPATPAFLLFQCNPDKITKMQTFEWVPGYPRGVKPTSCRVLMVVDVDDQHRC